MADAPAGRKENIFTRKIGPLPMWAWTAIIGGIVLVYALYQRSKQSQAQAAASSATAPNTVPPIVNQTYVTSPADNDTTNVTVTTPPDQDDHRSDNDADDRKKRKHPRPPKHPHVPGPATHHKVHRAHPNTRDFDADDPGKPTVFPIRRAGAEPRPGAALQGM